jgi:predicted XRE-type DNA-binding protein
MSIFDYEYKDRQDSKKINDEREILKLKLISHFLKLTKRMDTQDILFKTGLHKSDLSRLRSFGSKRFTIDRLVLILNKLGHVVNFNIKAKNVS